MLIFGSGGRASGVSVFTPASLSLTGWWQASFSGTPWSGAASAGSSGSNNLSGGGNPPSVGSAVNGYTPASFDGVNDTLSAAGTLDTYAASTIICGWALVNMSNITSGALIKDETSSATQVRFASSNVEFRINGASAVVSRAISSGSWQLITFRYNGTNVQVGVNEAPGAAGGGSTTAFSTALSSLAGSVTVGSSSAVITGSVLEVGLTDTALLDADFANIKTYCNDRYALSL